MTVFSDDLVSLRPITSADHDPISAYLNDPEMYGLRQVESDALAPIGVPAIAVVIDEWAAAKSGLALAITRAGSDEVLGHALCDWGWDAMNPWVGLAVAPEHRRNGYGSATASLLLRWLFDQTVAHSIQAWTPSWNEAGIAFLADIGFSPAGGIRRAWLRDGAWHDDLAFDLLRADWEGS